MKIFHHRTIRVLVLSGILAFTPIAAQSSITFQLGAATLQDSTGNPMPVNGLVLLVATTTDSVFQGPTPTSFVSADDVEVARFDLSSGSGSGDMDDFATLNLFGSWAAGNRLAIYWFPTLTKSATAPGAGTAYGFYRDPTPNGAPGTGVDGSDPWFTPADGTTLWTLYFLTSDAGGSNPNSVGLASHRTPPLAVSDTIERYPSQGVKVTFATLLSNDVGAGPLTLTHVSATSANGGTLTTNEGWVFYAPPLGFTNVDTFTYSVSDTNGGTTTGTVTINIKVDTGQSLNITGIATTEGTNQLISFIGIPQRSYTIQAATNLPSTNWQVIGTSTAGGGGLFNFKDTNAYLYPMRFYRSAYP